MPRRQPTETPREVDTKMSTRTFRDCICCRVRCGFFRPSRFAEASMYL